MTVLSGGEERNEPAEQTTHHLQPIPDNDCQ
jgi:hypothetical protein